MEIPDGTQDGKQFRLKEKECLLCEEEILEFICTSKNRSTSFLNKEQKELLEKFRKIDNEKSNPSIKKFFQKAKSFWNN